MKKVIIILLFIGWMPVAMSGQATAGFFNYNGQEQVIYPGQVATLELKVFNSNGGPYQITFQRNAEPPETKVDIPSTPFYWGETIYQQTTFTLLNVKNRFGEKINIDPNNATITFKVYGTGVEEDISSQLAICPNPARDIISISIDNIDDEDEILIYNMMGQYIKAVPSSGATDISDLKPGIYILKIPGRGAYKLVKQ